MKTPNIPPTLLLSLLLSTTALFAQNTGIPEPELIWYGTVVNGNTSQPVTSGQVTWTISSGASTLTVSTTLVKVNDQVFYLARVPLETRVVGTQTFAPSADKLELIATGTTLTRKATVGHTPGSSPFSFRRQADHPGRGSFAGQQF